MMDNMTMREARSLINKFKALMEGKKNVEGKPPWWRYAKKKLEGRDKQLREGFKKALGR